MPRLSETGKVRGKGQRAEDDTAPYLGRASGTGRRVTEDQIWQNSLCPAQGEHRARLCRREGKAWNALYESQRLGPGKTMGHAEICMHESEKAGKLVMGIAGFFHRVFLFLPFSSQKRGAGLSQHRVFQSVKEASQSFQTRAQRSGSRLMAVTGWSAPSPCWCCPAC